MARVQFLNGIFSGKLGGTVYAHNKAGYYVRQYSMPTNPNTVAQADARDEFTAAVTSWHLLDDFEKAFWNTYATGDFRGKDNDITVLYSGFNAFVSLWNTAKNAQRKSRHFTMEGNATQLLTFTPTDFGLSTSPPTGVFSANIQDYESDPLGVGLKRVALATDGKATFDLEFFASPGPQTGAPIFIEPITLQPVGYCLYASNVIGQAEHFVTKPNQTIIGVAEYPFEVGNWNPGDWYIRFTFDEADLSIPDHKLWYDVGDICRCEVWAVGENGPIIRVGEKIVTVQAPWE